MSRFKYKFISLAALLLAALVWVVFTRGPLASTKITIEKVRTGSLTSEIFGVGVTEARHSYNISPAMAGRVRSLLVDQSDYVTVGQVLVRMDPLDLGDKLVSSRLVAERAGNSVKMAEAQLAQAQSQEKTVAAAYTRYVELQSKGFISQEMLAAKLNEKNASQAALDSAVAFLAGVRRDNERAQSDAAGVAKLRDQTVLFSPVDGVVTARMVEQGGMAVPGQTLLQVIEPDDIWVKTRIDQKHAASVRVGQQARVVLRSQPHTVVSGTVKRVDMISDTVTEERIVNIAINAPEKEVSLGEYAEVTIMLPGLPNARSIPTVAVKRVNQIAGVWLLQEGHAKFRAIKTGIETLDGRTQVLDGLGDDDEVIIYSQKALKEGLSVKAVAELVRG